MFNAIIFMLLSVPFSACEYEYGEWSGCDPVSQTRRLEGTLLRTEDTPPDCEATAMKTKPCFGRNGRGKIESSYTAKLLFHQSSMLHSDYMVTGQ